MLIFLFVLSLWSLTSIILYRQYQSNKQIAIIFNQLSELNKKISLCDDSIYGIHKVSLRSIEDNLRTLNVKIIKVETDLLKNSSIEAVIEEE